MVVEVCEDRGARRPGFVPVYVAATEITVRVIEVRPPLGLVVAPATTETIVGAVDLDVPRGLAIVPATEVVDRTCENWAPGSLVAVAADLAAEVLVAASHNIAVVPAIEVVDQTCENWTAGSLVVVVAVAGSLAVAAAAIAVEVLVPASPDTAVIPAAEVTVRVIDLEALVHAPKLLGSRDIAVHSVSEMAF